MADLRYHTIPTPSTFKLGNAELTFFHLFAHIIRNDARFTSNGAGLRTGARLVAKYEGKTWGDVVILDEEDWRAERDAFEDPTCGFLPKLEDNAGNEAHVPQEELLRFLDSLSDAATKTAPAPKETANGKAEASKGAEASA